MNENTKKILLYGVIGVASYVTIVFIARRLGGKPYGIWIYR
jgi:hypothetical protein